jgi:hypothetical protein
VRLQQALLNGLRWEKIKVGQEGTAGVAEKSRPASSGFAGLSLAGSEVAATKVFQQLADTNTNKQERPIMPEELENIDAREVLDQEHRPNGD